MKKFVLAAAIAALGVTSQAHAAFTPIMVDADGAGGAGAFSITTLNWLSGNALTLGAMGVAGESAAAVGGARDLTSVYQASLGSFVYNPAGGSTTYALPSGMEWTVVATIKEIVTGIGSASSALSPYAGTISVYYGTANSNDISGFGYNDGLEILRGSIVGGSGTFSDLTRLSPTGFPPGNLDNFGANNAPGVTTHVGSGQSTIKVDIGATAGDFYDPTFFLSNISSFDFLLDMNEDANDTGQLASPFAQANPSDFVAGNAPRYSPGNINGGDCAVDAATGLFSQTCDFHFQTLNTTSFNAIPEPGSLALLGLSLGLLGTFGRRRQSSK